MMQDTSAPMVSRLTRVTVKPDNTLENPSTPETVILGTDASGPCEQPDNTRDCIPADYYWHTIGTVRSDPVDGTLWVGNGDAHPHAVNATSYRPYDEQTLAGKIIHVDRNGHGLPGHPFCPTETDLTKTCTKIYAKGFRNPFRFTLRPGKGPVVGDVGANDRGGDRPDQAGPELRLAVLRGHDPHPALPHPVALPAGVREGGHGGRGHAARPGTTTTATAPRSSAGAVYTGTRYPADYRGDIFVGDYVQGWVKRLEVDSSDQVTAVHDFASDWPTGVEIQSAPGDGDIAYTDLGWGGSGGDQELHATAARPTPRRPPRLPPRRPRGHRRWPSPSTASARATPTATRSPTPGTSATAPRGSTAANPATPTRPPATTPPSSR